MEYNAKSHLFLIHYDVFYVSQDFMLKLCLRKLTH